MGRSKDKARAKGEAAPKNRKVGRSTVAAKKKPGPAKGTAKTPGSGRKAGTPNRRTLELREALEAAGLKPDTHPVVMMYLVYTGEITMPVVVTEMTDDGPVNTVEDVPLKPDLRVKCMAEVAQYLEPKRKAVEVTGKDGGPVEFVDFATLPERPGGDPRIPPPGKGI